MKRFWLNLALVPMLALASACSDDDRNADPDPSASNDVPNLEDEFGGYTTANEQPGFGEPSILSLGEVEADFSDPVADDPAVLALQNAPNTEAYILAVRWGQLDKNPNGGIGDNEDEDRFDWSGSLQIDRGALVLTRVVAFERGDHVVLPRADHQTIEWVSRTGDGMDGIRVVVFAPRSGDDVGSEPIVTFNTPLFSTSFALSELADLDEVHDVDQEGNQVHFLAMASDAVASINGFVSGRWGWLEEDDHGAFAGVWIAPRTGINGWLRGHYGTNARGEDVFFGKYIDRSGNFQGFLHGRVQIRQGDLDGGSGRFHGEWFSSTREAIGEIDGRWVVADGGRGLFDGTWCFDCR